MVWYPSRGATFYPRSSFFFPSYVADDILCSGQLCCRETRGAVTGDLLVLHTPALPEGHHYKLVRHRRPAGRHSRAGAGRPPASARTAGRQHCAHSPAAGPTAAAAAHANQQLRPADHSPNGGVTAAAGSSATAQVLQHIMQQQSQSSGQHVIQV